MDVAAKRRTSYLEGNYAPVAREIEGHHLTVHGELPRDLAGTFLRNGSNPRLPPKGRYHWFDGDGMIHAVTLEGGRASYRNRWVRTKAFVAEEEAGVPLWTGVTERADLSNPRGPLKDTSNTDLVFHANKLLSLWWLGGEAYVVDPRTLETRGTEAFGGRMPTISAHPKVDAVTGEMMVFDYKPFPPYLTYGVVAPSGELAHTAVIDLPGPRLQHDVAITERFTIVMDMSLVWDAALLARGQSRVVFARDKPTRFGLLPRRGDSASVRWFEAAPCFMYHTINAWEEGTEIVLVGCKIDEPLADDASARGPRRDVPAIGFLRLEPYLHEWRFDLATGRTRERRLDERLVEFPRMDNRALGRKARFAYAQHLAPSPTLLFDGVVKYDLERGEAVLHRYPAGAFGGETVFAPREGATGEDDGYLLTFVVDERTFASELHVLDARDVARPALARVVMPQRVPTGYHAWWIPAAELRPEAPPA